MENSWPGNACLHRWARRGFVDGIWMLFLRANQRIMGEDFEAGMWESLWNECRVQGLGTDFCQERLRALRLDVHCVHEDRQEIGRRTEYFRIGSFPHVLPCRAVTDPFPTVVVYARDDEWFDVLRAFANDVNVILLNVSFATLGVRMEIEHICEAHLMEKTICLRNRRTPGDGSFIPNVRMFGSTLLAGETAKRWQSCLAAVHHRIIEYEPPLPLDASASGKLLHAVLEIARRDQIPGFKLQQSRVPPPDRVDDTPDFNQTRHDELARLNPPLSRTETELVWKFADMLWPSTPAVVPSTSGADRDLVLSAIQAQLRVGDRSDVLHRLCLPASCEEDLRAIYRAVFLSDAIDFQGFEELRNAVRALIRHATGTQVQVSVFECIFTLLRHVLRSRTTCWDVPYGVSFLENLRYLAANCSAVFETLAACDVRVYWDGDSGDIAYHLPVPGR